MKLFDQMDFSGGLNAEYDRLKTPRNSYPLLINGRIRNGNIQPIKKHVKDSNIPDGIFQNIITVGDYLIVFISGDILYKNILTGTSWNRIPGWTVLSTTADEIYATLIPISTNFLNTSGDPTAPDLAYNNRIAQTPQALLISDGVNQPRLLYANLSWEILNTYAQWSQDDPEYIPVVNQSVVSGVKLFSVSANKKQILQSVSGRYTDHVVNIDVSGNKGGDAFTTAYAVDFNDLTALQPTQQGGLIASTLYATYLLLPTDREIFNEPILSVGDPAFPIGAVNWKSYASILGDAAFIAQSGIHSINVSMQLQREANNNPFSRTIARYLVNPQSDTCATNFDDYALFAVNTTYGRGVFVYDTLREQFVSLDTGFGTVKRFAVYKNNGVNRLFFINTDNELYEAYGSTVNQTSRILLGDYVYSDQGVAKQMKVDNVFMWFNNITDTDVIRLAAYADGRLIDSSEVTPVESGLTNVPPVASPFIDQTDIVAVKYGLPPREAAKFSLWLEWAGSMELVGVSGMGSSESIVQSSAESAKTKVNPPIIVLSEPAIHTLTANTVTELTVSNLLVNEYYYVAGTAKLGSQVVTDSIFKAIYGTIKLTGKLYNIHDFRDLWLTAKQETNRQVDVITLGNFTDGLEPSYDKSAAILHPSNFYGPAGNLDLDDSTPAWYEHRERYFMYRTDSVEFFIISGGWNSANDSVDSSGNPTGSSSEIDGFSSTSAQAQWLRYWLQRSTRLFKVVLIGYPPYTDHTDFYPGYAPLRWPFAKWGADVVLSRAPGIYERFYFNGFPYINLGLGGDVSNFKANTNRSVVRNNSGAGYIVLQPRAYSLDILLKDANGDLQDSTTIYPR